MTMYQTKICYPSCTACAKPRGLRNDFTKKEFRQTTISFPKVTRARTLTRKSATSRNSRFLKRNKPFYQTKIRFPCKQHLSPGLKSIGSPKAQKGWHYNIKVTSPLRLKLTDASFKTFTLTGHISLQMMAVYSEQIMELSPSLVVMDTRIYPNLYSGTLSEHSYSLDVFRTANELIAIPYRGFSHWKLFLIDLTKKTCIHYDPGRFLHDPEDMTPMYLRKWFAEDGSKMFSLHKQRQFGSIENWAIKPAPVSFPRYCTNPSSGLFVLGVLECLAMKVPPSFNYKDTSSIETHVTRKFLGIKSHFSIAACGK